MKILNHTLLITSCMALTNSISSETYIVKDKDVLSKIIQNKFMNETIYGSKGLLRKILSLNPKIKNANKIFIDQEIILPDISRKSINQVADEKTLINTLAPLSEKPIETLPMSESIPLSSRLISNDLSYYDSWILKILYGSKFLSLAQSKTLSEFNINTIATDNLKVESEFKYDNYKFIGSYESHSFSYASQKTSHETTLSNLEFSSIYNNYLIGLSLKQIPIIKATTTSLDLARETQLGLILGYDMMWTLPTTKLTTVNLKSSITIPFNARSDKTDTTISSLKGFELKSNIELSRDIIKKENYSLKFIWQNELGYGQSSRNINWQNKSGKINLTVIEAKSLIGLGFSF